MTDSAQTKTAKKTKTLDEEIESRLADRKIALFRYDAHLRQQIYKKLTALQKRLLNRVTAAGIESISKKELNLLLKDITKLINESYADVSEFSRDELNQLLPVEIASTQQIYNKAVKFDLFNSVPDYKIKSIQNSQLIAGSPLENWWAKQGNELNFKFSNIIRQGMLDGKATSELILESKDLLASSRRWAETLVRTAVMKVHDQAQQALRDENLDIIKGEQHISTLDTRTSEVCRVRDGKAWDLNKKPIGDHDLPYQRPPIHPNCLIGDSYVLSRCGVSGAFKRWFEGEVVTITTSSGYKLTTTPNHPILTRNGWVGSNKINIGDYVVCDRFGKWGDIANWNDDNVPAQIEQVFRSFLMSGKMTSISMPTSTVDFHGDGINGDVAIVATNRFLMNKVNVSLFEHFHQRVFSDRRICLGFLNGFGLFFQRFYRDFLSPSDLMGFQSKGFLFCFGSDAHSSKLLLAAISKINAILFQDVSDRMNRDVEFSMDSIYTDTKIKQIYNIFLGFIDASKNNISIEYQLFCFCSALYRVFCEQSNNYAVCCVKYFGQTANTFPSVVEFNNFVRWQGINGSFSDFNPILSNDSVQHEIRDSELAHNLINGCIIDVFFDKVINIEREIFAGHVYNLETEDNWYIANGIITHNCRSTLRLITKSWQELGIDADEIPESTRASMDGQVKASLNYEDWLKGKSPEEQDAVLGKGKADLWRRGVITFRDMLDQSGRPLTLAQLQDFHQIPETVRKIRRTHWNDSFKNKAEAMYNDFKKSNITLDFHAVQRLAQRIDQNSDDYNEVKRMILNDKPNYIEPETGNLVRYNQSKGLAIIQSISDNEIITVVTDRYKPKQVWKKIN